MDNMIDIDVTIVIQLINFLIAIVVLNFLLIKPVREHLASRQALTAGLAQEIDSFCAEASSKLGGYESAIAEARTQATQAREAVKAEGTAREQELLRAAQADAQSFLQSAREDTARQAKAASDTLLSQVNIFAEQAMKKILG